MRPARAKPWSRVMGLQSIYAKTVRDSRRAAIVVGVLAGVFMLGTGAPYGVAPEFSTIELRRQFVAGLTALPLALRGILGEPINLETLGGFLSWRVGNILPVMLGLWSVLALSGTLAGEAAKGSLDLVASTPISRRRIAIQKLAGHVTALTISMLIAGLLIWYVGVAFASLPGDEIALGAALGQVLLYGLLMLASGSIAFATAPFVGRTRALAFGLVGLFASYLISSYASLSPLIDSLKPLSWYAWTAGHRPLAGVTDWPSVALLAVFCVILLTIGVVAFERRDLGNSTALSWLRLPSLPSGIGGPFRRQLSDRTGVALAWGIGIGIYSALIVASSKAFANSLGSLPQITHLIKTIYPDVDLQQPSGLLQLAFFAFGSFIISLAGATFVAGWASDEGQRRLDLILSAPLSRAAWAIRSGLGALAAIAVLAVSLAVIMVLAIVSQGGDVVAPVGGIAVLALASAAFASVGLAVGGLIRPSLGAGVTAALAIATFLIDTLGVALKLPDPVLQLSIFKHLGQPMVGVFDPAGIVISLIMIVGGVTICAIGLTRRDIGG
jgi:ABC-2 type transport system permease protein